MMERTSEKNDRVREGVRREQRERKRVRLTGGCSTLGALDGLCPRPGKGKTTTHVSLIPIRIPTIESLIALS